MNSRVINLSFKLVAKVYTLATNLNSQINIV